MLVKINGLNINYTRRGRGPNYLILHGWGINSQVFDPLVEKLRPNHTVWAIDLPGFGLSDMPPQPWGLTEYTELLSQFIDHFELESLTVQGHSFGGALAAQLASHRPKKVKRLILVSAAGGRKNTPLRAVFWILAKAGQILFRAPGLKQWRQAIRDNFYRYIVKETDYLKSGHLKETFQKVINRDIKDIYGAVKTPTLIIWGEKDKITPLKGGNKIHRLIPQSQIRVMPDCGHMCYLEAPENFYKIVEEFTNQPA